MKDGFKNMFRNGSYLYNLFSYLYHIKKNYWLPPKYDSLHNLIAVYANIRKNIYFLQVGANDGVSNDPLNEFISSFNWGGICVEPLPENFKKLRETYDGKSEVILVNAAVGNGDDQKIYFVNPQKAKALNIEIPDWFNQLASFDKKLVVSDLKGDRKDEIVDELDIKSISFATLIKEYNVTKVDLLHIDTEGADWMILSSFPFELFLPDVIIFEHNHLEESDYKTANDLLRKKGYRLIRVGTDTFCYTKKLKAAYEKIMKETYFIAK